MLWAWELALGRGWAEGAYVSPFISKGQGWDWRGLSSQEGGARHSKACWLPPELGCRLRTGHLSELRNEDHWVGGWSRLHVYMNMCVLCAGMCTGMCLCMCASRPSPRGTQCLPQLLALTLLTPHLASLRSSLISFINSA